MKIYRLTLENFRCFEVQTIALAPQFNVFIGNNGTGKTAMLDALAVSVGSFLLGIDVHSARTIRDDDARLLSNLATGVPTLEPQYPVQVSAEGEVNGQPIAWRRSLHGKGRQTTWKEATNLKEIAAHLQEEARRGKPVTLPLIAYYGTGRMWERSRYMLTLRKPSALERPTNGVATIRPGSRLDGYQKCLTAESNQTFLDGWLKTHELSVLQRQTTSPALEGIKEVLAHCMDTWTKVYYDLLLDELVAEDAQHNRLPIRLLSDGQRNMLYMALDIAYRAVALNPHLEGHASRNTPGVVLIDEIDLHLHPKWQRRVVDDLRSTFPEIQFITTTHSPSIIQSLREGELIDLKNSTPKEYLGLSLEDIVENVMDVPLPQRSLRSLEMIEAAEAYYTVLQEAQNTSGAKLKRLKQRLDALSEPFADNEAYIAFLRQERLAAGVGGE